MRGGSIVWTDVKFGRDGNGGGKGVPGTIGTEEPMPETDGEGQEILQRIQERRGHVWPLHRLMAELDPGSTLVHSVNAGANMRQLAEGNMCQVTS